MTATQPAADQIRDWVVGHYLETGEDATVKEIAEGLSWSESKVRKAVNDNAGIKGVTCFQEERARYHKGYDIQCGTTKVWLYGPTRETLRKLLNERV